MTKNNLTKSRATFKHALRLYTLAVLIAGDGGCDALFSLSLFHTLRSVVHTAGAMLDAKSRLVARPLVELVAIERTIEVIQQSRLLALPWHGVGCLLVHHTDDPTLCPK